MYETCEAVVVNNSLLPVNKYSFRPSLQGYYFDLSSVYMLISNANDFSHRLKAASKTTKKKSWKGKHDNMFVFVLCLKV